MLKLKNIGVNIGSIEILSNIDLEIDKFSSVVGRNGAGKTTLIRSIMGTLPLRSGYIEFKEKNISLMKPHMISQLGIGYMPEDRRLVPDLTVKENILIPLWAKRNKSEYEYKLEKVLNFIPEIKAFLNRGAFQLSGGQQKLVALARAMVVGEKLLLLDEPFEGVAPALAERLVDVIQSLSKLDLLTLITESDQAYSKKINANIIKIERGKIYSTSA